MCNIGMIDRIIRAIVGIGLIVWGFATQNVWGAVGIIPLATAAFSFCPLYALLKMDTGCKA